MDWLNKARQFVSGLIGGAGKTISNIAGGVARGVGQAEQQASQIARRAVSQAQQQVPRFQAPQMPRIQFPTFTAPKVPQIQAPKIDFGAVSRALGQQVQGVGEGMNIGFKQFTGQQLTPKEQQVVDFAKQNVPGFKIATDLQQGMQQWDQQVKQRQIQSNKDFINQFKTSPATAIFTTPGLSPFGNVSQVFKQFKVATGKELPKFDTTKAVEDLSTTLSQTPLKNIPGMGIASDIVKPLAMSAARMADVAQTQEQYSNGIKGLGEMGIDIANVGSAIYTGGLSTSLGKAGLRESLPLMAKLAPRLAASGAGQNILQQLAEGKKINELDPKQIAIASAAYTGFGLGLPLAPKLAGAGINKLLSPAQSTLTGKATRQLLGIPTAEGKVAQALPTDKNALVIAGSLPEKGALRAQGYTNVKVQFQPKPGQVAPTMQGIVAENTYPRQVGGKFGPASKAPIAATADYQALQQTARDAQNNLIKMRQSGQFTERQMKPYADNVNKLNQQMVDMRTGKLPTIYENVPKSYLQPKGEVPKIPVGKESGFIASIKKSPEISKDLSISAQGSYTPITKKGTLANTEKLFKNNDIGTVEKNVINRISSKTAPNAQTTSDAIALIKYYDTQGNHEAALNISNQLSEKLTQSGQSVWAASLLNNRTPEGILYGARKALNNAGVNITPELESSLQTAVNKIKTSKGLDKDMAIKEMQHLVAQQIPSSFGEKAVALWKAGLLTGIKTQTGNALSNVSNIALKKSSDPLAAAIDTVLSKFTGKRTKTFTGRGLISGTAEGITKAAKYMKTGIDERAAIPNKFDMHLVNYGKSLPGKAAQAYTDFVFKLMGAADRPYYYASLRNNLNDMALAEAKNQGLKGAQKSAFIKNFINEPPVKQLQVAIDAAEKSVFANDTLLSKGISGTKMRLGKFQPVADIIAPFTKVPSAIVTRVLDYTPIGAIKTIGKQIAERKLDQRALSEGLAEAGTGTAAIWIGYQLSQAGLMTGAYPTDPNEQELWKMEGKQPYSIKFNNQWHSLNYVSPLGQILAIGNNISDAQKKGETLGGSVLTGTLGLGKSVVDQSFLQGVQGALDVLTKPQLSAQKFVNNQAASLIPTLSSDIAKALDPLQRQQDTALEAIKAKIPFMSQQLNPKLDAFGNPIQQKSKNPLDTLFNPFRPSDIPNQSDLNVEIRRLHDAKLNVLPDISGKDFFAKGGTLDKKQQQQVKSELGPLIQDAMNKIIANPKYAGLSDEDKKKVLSKAKEDVTASYKQLNYQNYNQEAPKGKLSADQLRIAKGGDVKFKLPGEKPSNPAEKYQAAVDKYNQDKADGTISKFEDVTRQKELQTLQVASKFSNDVVDVYGLNGKQIKSLMDNKSISQDLWNQVVAYGDSLVNAGLIDKNKFKDKYGNIYLPGTAPKGGKGKSKRISLKSPSLKPIRVSAPKARKVSFKVATPTKARKSIKIKTG